MKRNIIGYPGKTMLKKVVLLSLIILLSIFLCNAQDITPIDSFPLEENTQFINPAASFSVIDSGYILIPDSKAGHIKIFNMKGNLVKIFGKKGHGPNEFCKPLCCDYAAPIFVVYDYCSKIVYFYEIKQGLTFIHQRTIKNISSIYDLKKVKNQLLIAGFTEAPGNKKYEFYTFDPADRNKRYLLTPDQKYGMKVDVHSKTYLNIAATAMHSLCDYAGDDVYFNWAGDLVIQKINLKTGTIKKFGKKTPFYVKPVATENMLKAMRTRDVSLITKEFLKISFILRIFSFEDMVGLVYDSPGTNGKKKVFLQLYNSSGEFLKEIQLAEAERTICSFDKKERVIYLLCGDTSCDDETTHKICRFKVSK